MQKWCSQNDNNPLTIEFVQQKQLDLIKEKGPMTFAFLRADYNECLDLFAKDISALVDADIVSRLTTMYRIMYGKPAEILAALVSTTHLVLKCCIH